MILAAREHMKWSIVGLLKAVSGHPMQETKFVVYVYDIETRTHTKFPLDIKLDNANGELIEDDAKASDSIEKGRGKR